MTLLRKLLNDEHGFIVSSELVVIATLLVVGMMTGMQVVQSSVVGEMNEVATSIGSLNQSYGVRGMHGCCLWGSGWRSWTAGSCFNDCVDQVAVTGDIGFGDACNRCPTPCGPSMSPANPALGTCFNGCQPTPFVGACGPCGQACQLAPIFESCVGGCGPVTGFSLPSPCQSCQSLPAPLACPVIAAPCDSIATPCPFCPVESGFVPEVGNVTSSEFAALGPAFPCSPCSPTNGHIIW